jgi:hypothetical protein
MGSVYRHFCLEKLSQSFNLQTTYTQPLSDSVANVPLVPTVADKIHKRVANQNVPSVARVAAGAFGFLTLIHVFDGPERLSLGYWSLRPFGRTSSAFKRYFDCAGHCSALLSWHGNHVPVSFSAIAGSELIAAFAGLTRVWIKVRVVIHTVRLRVGRSLGVRLSGVRQDQYQTHRKAGS